MNSRSSRFEFGDFKQSHLLNQLLFDSDDQSYEFQGNKVYNQVSPSSDDFSFTVETSEQPNTSTNQTRNFVESQEGLWDTMLNGTSHSQHEQEQGIFSSLSENDRKSNNYSFNSSGKFVSIQNNYYEEEFATDNNYNSCLSGQMMNSSHMTVNSSYVSPISYESSRQLQQHIYEDIEKPNQTKILKRSRSSSDISLQNDSFQSSCPDSKNNQTERGIKKSRLSKTPKKEDLEERIQKLKQENEQLKVFVQDKKQMVTDLEVKRYEMEKKLKEALDRHLKESEIVSMIQSYKCLFSDYGEQRRKEVEFHLNRLEKLSSPTVITKMTLYTLQQNFESITQSGDLSLVSIMCEELNIDAQQKAELALQRENARKLTDEMKRTKYLIDQLKRTTQQRLSNFEKKMGLLQSILYPTQCARLILWVSEHNPLIDSNLPFIHFHLETKKKNQDSTDHSNKTQI